MKPEFVKEFDKIWDMEYNATGFCVNPKDCEAFESCEDVIPHCGIDGNEPIVCCPAYEYDIEKLLRRPSEKSKKRNQKTLK